MRSTTLIIQLLKKSKQSVSLGVSDQEGKQNVWKTGQKKRIPQNTQPNKKKHKEPTEGVDSLKTNNHLSR